MYRIWVCVAANAIQKVNHANAIILQSQKGFIKGINGCLEHSATANELFYDARRNQRSIYMMAIDLSDAFGSVPHQMISANMKQLGFPDHLTKIIQDAFQEGMTTVQVEQRRTHEITIKRGVKQGCPLFPLLFNICLELLLKRIDSMTQTDGYSIGIANQDGSYKNSISVQAYADDLILISKSIQGLEHLVSTVDNFT
jgi:hypothetical protein